MNARQIIVAPAGADITSLQLAFGGACVAPPERDLPIGYTVMAAIEYPLGHFSRVTFAGAETLRVEPGRTLCRSDSLPVTIPAGARAAVKLFMAWEGGQVDFPLTSYGINTQEGEWLAAGTDLTDQTMTAATAENTYPTPPYAGVGAGCAIYGTLSAAVPVLGILGDSISHGSGDYADPVWGGAAIERGVRAQIPVINVSCQAEDFAGYLGRPDGRRAFLDDAITHLVVSLGRNDVSMGRSGEEIAASLQHTIAPFLERGVRVFAVTVTPRTGSTDQYTTVRNQQTHHPDHERARLAYNTWLRQNAQAVGLAGIFDWAHAVDPLDTGVWPAYGNGGHGAVGVATLSDGHIAHVRRARFSAGREHGGTGYPPDQTAHPCVVLRYPDDPIRSGDAIITCETDADGVVMSYSVVEGGQYTVPPMVAPAGALTADGTHPTGLGYNLMIAGSGFGLQAFTL